MNLIKGFRLIELPTIQDGIDGTISIVESRKQIPFDVKRVYYVYNLANQVAVRGNHAHKELEQVLFCISGSFKLHLHDGQNQMDFIVYKPNVGVYLGIDLWHSMTDFSSNCIFFVLASDYYNESDYIRNYDDFINYVACKNLKSSGLTFP